jgi:hypothetical protein
MAYLEKKKKSIASTNRKMNIDHLAMHLLKNRVAGIGLGKIIA